MDDNSILASGTNPEQETYEVIAELPPGDRWSAVRLEGLTHESFPKGGIGRSANSNVVLTDFAVFIAPSTVDTNTSPTENSETETQANDETDALPTFQPSNQAAESQEPKAESQSTEVDVEGETADVDPEDPWTRIPVVHAWAEPRTSTR